MEVIQRVDPPETGRSAKLCHLHLSATSSVSMQKPARPRESDTELVVMVLYCHGEGPPRRPAYAEQGFSIILIFFGKIFDFDGILSD